MESNPHRMAVPQEDAADAVPQIDAIHAANTLYRTFVNRENDTVALTKRHNDRPRLHAWPLLCHHEFATGEVLARFRQQNSELERKDMLAVKVLMQAVVIIGSI